MTWSGRKNGYGNVVEVGHADGYTTLYAHNQKNLVEVGDLVKRGQVLARSAAPDAPPATTYISK